MKTLVIGASGFLGSHLVRELLKRNFKVRVFVRPESSLLALENLEVEIFFGDLNNLSSLNVAMKGCSSVFHAGAYYPLYSLDREAQIKEALQQTQHFLKALEKNKIKKCIYTSSISTIGKETSSLSNEETPYESKKMPGLYYEIKYLMEQEVLKAARKSLPIIIMNPTGLFGEGDVKPTSGTLVLEIARKNLPFIFNGKMNVVDVREVAHAQVNALEKGRIGERYILGGVNTTFPEFCQIVAGLAKVSAPHFKMPLVLARPLALAAEIFSKAFNQQKPIFPVVGLDFIQNGIHVDCQKAKDELGLRETNLKETIGRTLQWFRKKGYFEKD
ncbi:MAG: NAD-dependent epimerase/dehydratase family protein [Deltaproteobacteria bacterium]|nr:NAD-dependent epimerase/dehydratase family protein [Deltaproteobacteria bacterium]